MVIVSSGRLEPPPEMCEAALSMVLRDMGNGVTRLLSANFVSGAIPPRDFFEVFGVCDVPIPLSERMRDAVDCAAMMHGREAGQEYVGGYMRSLAEEITEFIIW